MTKKSLSLEALSKRKNDIIFSCVGIFLLLITGYIFFDSVTFLTLSVEKALLESSDPVALNAFNLKGLETIGLVIPSPSPALQLPSDLEEGHATRGVASPVSSSSSPEVSP